MAKPNLCTIIAYIVLTDCFELINTNYRAHSSTVLNFINSTRLRDFSGPNGLTSLVDRNALNNSKAIKKRAANNFFEDEDKSKSNNIDYIDFNGVYKDEVRSSAGKEVKNKRTIKRRPRRRRKRRKHRPFRFKRKDDSGSSKFRVSLKPSYSDLINYGIDQIKPKNLIGLKYEDSFHRIVQHVIKPKNGDSNGKDATQDKDENAVNKIIDNLTSNRKVSLDFFIYIF